MATTYKVLGQVSPSATTTTTLYTVPSSTECVVSSLVICNRAATSGTYRVAVRPNAETLANKHYLIYDSSVIPNDTVALTLGITMDASDVIEVYTSSANFSISLFGSEVS